MLTKKHRILLFALIAVVIAAFAAAPALQPVLDQLRYRVRTRTGGWGDGSVRFVDVSQKAGLDYHWSIPGPRPLDILQTIGAGCAFLDYDNSGDLSLLLVGPDHVALFQGDGRGHFTDVSRQVGLDKLKGHFLGCAVGDYDNDGYDDVYLSGYRTGVLLHNAGGRRFVDVTRAAGLRPQPWGTSCGWGDVDGNGRLSLYVANYIQYDPVKGPRLCSVQGTEAACSPLTYPRAIGVLYHNEGNGRFRDVTKAWGADKVSGNALGVAFVDLNGSGRQSLVVANDSVPSDLLLNVGGRFRNIRDSSGINQIDFADANYAGMGVDWGDFDNDGHLDLVVGTFALATKPVYRGVGPGVFTDVSAPLGLREPTYNPLTFGVKWLDYDNDGWLDLMMTDGHVRDNIAAINPDVKYLEPTLLFHSVGGRRLADVSEQAGPDLPRPIEGRGLAVGDFDNDGKVDALVADGQGAPLLLHNESRVSGHWLSLTLVGTRSNRDGYGATVTVRTPGLTQTRVCHADGSYLSSSDKRVHVGLGGATSADLTVRWPSGTVTTLRAVPADRQITITEGETSVRSQQAN